jgi:hypothetical protein
VAGEPVPRCLHRFLILDRTHVLRAYSGTPTLHGQLRGLLTRPFKRTRLDRRDGAICTRRLSREWRRPPGERGGLHGSGVVRAGVGVRSWREAHRMTVHWLGLTSWRDESAAHREETVKATLAGIRRTIGTASASKAGPRSRSCEGRFLLYAGTRQGAKG